ncbi:MAG: barstar family protein [Oscillospiraceae bacterium]|nr:barstar family protein [Oscillospiraceae bacterium]
MTALIDGAVIETRGQLHNALSEQLALPEYYGRNLDALFDCLTDIHEDTELRLVRTDELFAHLGVYADVFQTVLSDAAVENPHLRLVTEEG